MDENKIIKSSNEIKDVDIIKCIHCDWENDSMIAIYKIADLRYSKAMNAVSCSTNVRCPKCNLLIYPKWDAIKE